MDDSAPFSAPAAGLSASAEGDAPDAGASAWAAEIAAASQPELRARYKQLLHTTTRSNNAAWLRRKVLEAAAGAHARGGDNPPVDEAPPGDDGSGVAHDALDASGVRKSKRAVKPRSLDLLPSGTWHLAPGLAAVGRRVKIHWPDEQAWFSGRVTRFDALTGRHHVSYDDGDSEELRLAAECIEWIQGEGPAPSAAYLDADDDEPLLGDQPGDGAHGGRRLLRKEDTAFRQDAGWPRVGDMLWGRVKGHGWWPGRVVRPADDRPSASTVSVVFFDDTSGWVPRADCLPFAENFEVLHSRKKMPAFVKAAKMAWTSWGEKLKQRSEKKRHSAGGAPAGGAHAAKKARGAPATAGPLVVTVALVQPLAGGGKPAASRPRQARPRGRRSMPSTGRDPSQRGKPRPAPPRGFNGSFGLVLVGGKAADVNALARRLEELQTRLGPIAAQAHERVAAQLRTLVRPDSRRMPASTASWASQERKRLLSQLEELERLPRSPAAAPAVMVELCARTHAPVRELSPPPPESAPPPIAAAPPAKAVVAVADEPQHGAAPCAVVDGYATADSAFDDG